MAGRGGNQRIGNNRATCPTCNKFAQAVRRVAERQLKASHTDEYAGIVTRVEVDLYPQVIDAFDKLYPSAKR